MNLLDENFPEDQTPLLKEWRIPFRQIGHDVARHGIKDPEIIPLLHKLRGVTFFTQDVDFFRQELSHPAYCLVWLDVRADDAVLHVRRFLRQPEFATQAKRMGKVLRVHHGGIHLWQRNRAALQRIVWMD